MPDQIKLRSKIPSARLKESLFRGTILASMGAAILLYASVRLTSESLTIWGPWVFGGGLFLITLGMLPYRRLASLQSQPDELIVEPTQVHLKTKGNILFSLPLASIAIVYFLEKPQHGIAIELKDPVPEKIIVRSEKFSMDAFQRRNKKRFGTALFFPHFTKRSADELNEVLKHLPG